VEEENRKRLWCAVKNKEQLAEREVRKMRLALFRRPLLCRLCECPAADGGVRVSQLDRDKLSEWLEEKTGHRFDLDGQEERNSIICRFCIWDAR